MLSKKSVSGYTDRWFMYPTDFWYFGIFAQNMLIFDTNTLIPTSEWEIWKDVQNESCQELNFWQLLFWTSFHISNQSVILAKFCYFCALIYQGYKNTEIRPKIPNFQI